MAWYSSVSDRRCLRHWRRIKVRLLISALFLFLAVSGYGQATTVLQLRVITGNPISPVVTPVNPNVPFDVGSYAVAEQTGFQLAVLNTDSVPHTLANMTVSANSDFTLATPFSGPVTLQPNVQVALSPTLVFKPSTAGPGNGQLSLFDDEPGSPQKYALTGTGFTDFGTICTNGGQSLLSIDFYCTQDVNAGQFATYFLRLRSVNSFSGPVTMTCSGLPQGTSCTMFPPAFSFTAQQTVQDVDLRVTTTGQSAALPPASRTIWWAFGALSAITLATQRRRPQRRLLISLVFSAFILSCGGRTPGNSGKSGPTPPGTFPFAFTATVNGVSHSRTMTLVVK